jgi:hypothetical protein
VTGTHLKLPSTIRLGLLKEGFSRFFISCNKYFCNAFILRIFKL